MLNLAIVNVTMRALRLLLFPFSFLYGLILWFRNLLYDKGFLASAKGELPSIVIGNLNTGGTGKTPHTIALAQMLSDLHPAILSRGYGRNSKGFIELNQEHSAFDVGDEPLLYLRSTACAVAVCEDRVEGIKTLAKNPNNKCVILDDAFQHRRLKADFNILIIAQAKPVWKDYYLPTGDLRDHKNQIKRANAILFSGCASESDYLKSRANLKLKPNQKAYWSQTHQLPLQNWKTGESPEFGEQQEVVLITAIAKAERLKKHLEQCFKLSKHFQYRDHHFYSAKEAKQWLDYLANHPKAILVTSEKDAVRMSHLRALSELDVYVAPINVEIQGVAELINDLKSSLEIIN